MITHNKIKCFEFKIGANNTTKRREIKKAESVLFNFGLGGFDVVLSRGFWIGEKKTYKENSFIISYLDKQKKLNITDAQTLKEILKRELKQEDILLTQEEKTIL